MGDYNYVVKQDSMRILTVRSSFIYLLVSDTLVVSHIPKLVTVSFYNKFLVTSELVFDWLLS